MSNFYNNLALNSPEVIISPDFSSGSETVHSPNRPSLSRTRRVAACTMSLLAFGGLVSPAYAASRSQANKATAKKIATKKTTSTTTTVAPTTTTSTTTTSTTTPETTTTAVQQVKKPYFSGFVEQAQAIMELNPEIQGISLGPVFAAETKKYSGVAIGVSCFKHNEPRDLIGIIQATPQDPSFAKKVEKDTTYDGSLYAITGGISSTAKKQPVSSKISQFSRNEGISSQDSLLELSAEFLGSVSLMSSCKIGDQKAVMPNGISLGPDAAFTGAYRALDVMNLNQKPKRFELSLEVERNPAGSPKPYRTLISTEVTCDFIKDPLSIAINTNPINEDYPYINASTAYMNKVSSSVTTDKKNGTPLAYITVGEPKTTAEGAFSRAIDSITDQTCK